MAISGVVAVAVVVQMALVVMAPEVVVLGVAV